MNAKKLFEPPEGFFIQGLTLSEPEGRIEGSLAMRSFDSVLRFHLGTSLRMRGRR